MILSTDAPFANACQTLIRARDGAAGGKASANAAASNMAANAPNPASLANSDAVKASAPRASRLDAGMSS